MFVVNNKDTRILTFTPWSRVSIVNFEKVNNGDWVSSNNFIGFYALMQTCSILSNTYIDGRGNLSSIDLFVCLEESVRSLSCIICK